jgi:hypothetical protein
MVLLNTKVYLGMLMFEQAVFLKNNLFSASDLVFYILFCNLK